MLYINYLIHLVTKLFVGPSGNKLLQACESRIKQYILRMSRSEDYPIANVTSEIFAFTIINRLPPQKVKAPEIKF